MIVSWNWLKDYVPLDVPVTDVERKLMLAGLNHEDTNPVGDDLAIDLEVTSNRPDCLGHIGIAREAAVLFGQPLKMPAANPPTATAAVAGLTRVTLQAPALCPRYTARVIRGVKIKASPQWMVDRLATIGIAAINNVVDVTNYVLMECGQPLHAFDLHRLDGREIIVRDARQGEKFLAINHKTYELEPGMCVISDRSHAVGLGGVMGGANTEVGPATADVLIEAAQFDPISIRSTARKLNLHSDSSYRFERGLDPEGVDWASRRACELILELAGGELAAGVIDVGRPPAPRDSIVLRLSQLERVLGITVPVDRVRKILAALGNEERTADAARVEVIPPSWRRDLAREIDLIEEVARIHGYDAIPEDVHVPMAASARTHRDRVLGRLRTALVGAGLDEAMTSSAVEEAASEAFSPWTDAPALRSPIPVLRRADRLRRSLIPSLLLARRTNEAVGNPPVELFEVARVYLPRPKELPQEELMLSLTSGDDFLRVKGLIEGLFSALNAPVALEVRAYQHPLLQAGRAAELSLGGERIGFLGEVSAAGLKEFELRGAATVAEVHVAVLEQVARLIPQAGDLPPYPAVSRDLNLVVEEAVSWGAVEQTVRASAGPELEQIKYLDTYRDQQRLGQGKKSLLFSMVLRSREGTLTSGAADQVRDAVLAQCAKQHGAKLRAS
ncbi:MAG: phenylalanine--tRNA ligase subunit beta [Pirellulales bacterium]